MADADLSAAASATNAPAQTGDAAQASQAEAAAHPLEAAAASAAPRKPRVPSEKQLAAERANAARAENLKRGREALAAKRAEGGTEKSETETKTKPSAAALNEGAKLFVRFAWMVSGLGARIAGGKLRPLTESELADGAKDALPILTRWSWMVSLLTFLGFPLWLGRMVSEAFERKAAPAGKSLALVPTDNAAERAASIGSSAVIP